ncbi:MAG: peptidoglycan DD-metalloendopeptidase family protein [Bacteroidota bacterium]
MVLFFLLASTGLWAQKNKTQLEQEKKENLRKIAEAEKILSETQSRRKVTVGQLQALEQQIKARESLITGLKQEVGLLNTEISDLTIVVNALQVDLENLREEYATMIYSAYKTNFGYNIVTYLFAAETFNQLFQRMQYLDQYAESRRIQVEQIEVVADELNAQRTSVQVKRDEQSTLLSQQLQESRKLQNSRKQKSGMIATLTKKESQLRKEVTARKRAIDKLDRTIAAIVRKEIRNAEKATAIEVLDEEEFTMTFERQKKNLDWPVASGFISKKFGTQPHPVLRRIKTENNGVDIQTNGQELVRTVHAGEVKMVGYLQGMNNFVMVKHGKYFTVYSRLKNVMVEKGQQISALDPIGEVYTDQDGISEVHFEVWRNTSKLDPETWLRPL